ncbi:Tn3 family transposase [Kitasatospora sp. NPDC089509]|uniref:Tn3 family transposase n=1 Tax=Kitasatospora sp. NPDC089509 TaxID=3364079 RepID=UPI00381D8519
MEDRVGALGPALHALMLFNTRYVDTAFDRLRAGGFDVRDEDVARLSPFVRRHVNRLAGTASCCPRCPAACGRYGDPEQAEARARGRGSYPLRGLLGGVRAGHPARGEGREPSWPAGR